MVAQLARTVCLDWATRYNVPVIPAVVCVSSGPKGAHAPSWEGDSLRARSSALGRRAVERALFGASHGKRGRRLELEARRRTAFTDNILYIERHNDAADRGEHAFVVQRGKGKKGGGGTRAWNL